jgi:hypothetical protein
MILLSLHYDMLSCPFYRKLNMHCEKVRNYYDILKRFEAGSEPDPHCATAPAVTKNNGPPITHCLCIYQFKMHFLLYKVSF